MKTNGYGGRSIKKGATVHTNDKKRPTLRLTISGLVERFVKISPSRVVLSGYTDTEISRSVEILPVEKYPFTILDAKARKGEDIHFELSEMTDTNPQGYTLRIDNLKKSKGRYHDQIILKTDSKIKPVIQISVSGLIKDKEPVEKRTPPVVPKSD